MKTTHVPGRKSQTLAWIGLAIIWLAIIGLATTGLAAAEISSPPAQGASTTSGALSPPIEAAAIEHLRRLSDRVFCGGEPLGEEAFAELAGLGVRTIVSVDGARPQVQAARRHQLRYVHLPIGYDGIPEATLRGLQHLLQTTEEPVFIHCHHGRHRGPAAAAAACLLEGSADIPAAIAILEQAGTSRDYPGLWNSIRQFQPPNPALPFPPLVEVAVVDDLAAAMAILDRGWDGLTLCREAGWKTPPAHPDLDVLGQLKLVEEGLRESARAVSSPELAELRQQLDEAAQEAAKSYERASRSESPGPLWDGIYLGLKRQCRDCHTAHRNR